MIGPLEIVTGMFEAPSPSRLLTCTASVPWLAPTAPIGGAMRLSILTGAVRLPTAVEVTVVRMRR